MWVHRQASRTLLQDIYNRDPTDEFSWMNLDQGRLYAWSHPWCICIAKKKELRIYEHALTEDRPTRWVDDHLFPYTITLCWMEFQKKIYAVAAGASEVEELEEDLYHI